MIYEVAVILLFGMFGWKTALIYVVTGLFIAISAGWITGKLKLEKWVEEWVYKTKFGEANIVEEKINFEGRLKSGYEAVKEIVGKVWIYVALGIAVGAGAHGYVPEEFMASLMGKSAWYSVPLPEMIILRKELKLPLIMVFVGVVATGIMIVGYLFNYIY
jgi:uncharacterized protein